MNANIVKTDALIVELRFYRGLQNVLVDILDQL